MARKLYRAYTSSRAQARAMHDTEGLSEWSRVVPAGSTWTGEVIEDSSADVGITAKKSKPVASKKPVEPQESSAAIGPSKPSNRGKKGPAKSAAAESIPNDTFKGDRVLARSIAFMRDTMWSRECAYAVAEGDAGRVYETLKVSPS